MKNETSYLSPLTGRTYTVVATPRSRVDYREFMNPETKYIREYTEYEIYFEGRKVQFAFDLDKVAVAVANFEGVTDGWTTSRFD